MSYRTPIKGAENLSSNFGTTVTLAGRDAPVRLEGEIGDVMVRGTIPDSIDGTFYRVGSDHFVPTTHLQTAFDGHGLVNAFRIHKGRVDFKIKYVQTDQYKIERRARQSLWATVIQEPRDGIHPGLDAVVQQWANINVVHWAGRLLALNENGPAYTMHPDTLETTGVDPFGNQISTPAFTAHPKIDSDVNELLAWSCNGPSAEMVSYSVDRQGIVKNEHRFCTPRPTTCHDIAMTKNWIIFCLWPNYFNINGKVGESLLIWDKSLPATFVVAPRHPDKPLKGSGWKAYETRVYTHPICSCIVHTAGAWEENGKIVFEGSWPRGVHFPFIEVSGGETPGDEKEKTRIEYVRLQIDPNLPANTQIPDPEVLVTLPNEFPRIDERFFNKKYDHVFMNVHLQRPGQLDFTEMIYQGLNATIMLNTRTRKMDTYDPGPDCQCQEPIFIPRSDDAPEGDGYVLTTVNRLGANRTNVVILDTKDFENPIAVIELPLCLRAQVHGSWVDARDLNNLPLVVEPPLHNMVWLTKKHRL